MNPDVFATPLVRIRQPDRTGGVTLPGAHEKGRDLSYGASSAVWRSLTESEMRAVLVVVANILREQAFQVAFVNCDDVIQEITPATPTQRSATPLA